MLSLCTIVSYIAKLKLYKDTKTQQEQYSIIVTEAG